MATFMDVHTGFHGVTARQLEEAHGRDLAIEVSNKFSVTKVSVLVGGKFSGERAPIGVFKKKIAHNRRLSYDRSQILIGSKNNRRKGRKT